MKAIRGQTTKIACLVSTFAVICSGCTVGGKSFAIDSNSRVPFFGLELRERGRKSSAPAFQSISRTKGTSGEVMTAMQVAPAMPAIIKNGQGQRIRSVETTQPNERSTREVTKAEATAPDKGLLAIPVTRPDESKKPTRLSIASEGVDFQ